MINKMDIYSKASSLRKKLGFGIDTPLPDINILVSQLEKVTLVLYPLGNKISGACIENDESAIIAVNSSMSKGRQRFTFAHELYHYLYDGKMESVICPKTVTKGDKVEEEADLFASYLLMPPDSVYEKVQKIKEDHDNITVYDVVRLEQYYGVSRLAMLYKLKTEGFLSEEEAKGMQDNPSLTARAMGFPTDLYKPLQEEKMMTYGYYITKCKDIMEKGLISEGKYEELLLDGFRTDLVYGDEPKGGDTID